MRNLLKVLLLLVVASCGSAPIDPGVGGVTRGEAEALNDAAEMLDQTEPPPRLTDDSGDVQAPPVPKQ